MTDHPGHQVSRAPRGLGQLDARVPAAYGQSIASGTRVLVDYFSALADRDARALAGCMHYPFGTFEGITPVVVEDERQLLDDPPASMDLRPGAALLPPGGYDLLDELATHLYGQAAASASGRTPSGGRRDGCCTPRSTRPTASSATCATPPTTG
jgi:hypothetical protein